MSLEIKETKPSRRPAGGYPISHPTLPDRPLPLSHQRAAARSDPTEGREARNAAGRRGTTQRPRNVSSYPSRSTRSIISTSGGLFQQPQ